MRSKYYLTIALLPLLAASCTKSETTTVTDNEDEKPRVELGVAHRQDVKVSKSYTANVQADNINNISPSAPNRIKTITVDVGDKVSRGQVVATLDQSNIEQLKLNLENTQQNYDRAVQLLNIGAGTQQSVDQLKTQLDALRSQYNNLMENTILTSPISGVVTARNYDPGDMTGGQPVLTVGQISPNVKVMINVTENDFSKISKGMPVTVTFDAFPDEVFEGKISRIYPTVDPATRTFQTEILVANPHAQILPGMFSRVVIDLGTQNNVVVPDRAVVKQQGSNKRFVFVYRDGKVSYIPVELGQRINDSYELLSGVQDGDSVVISDKSRLIDGTAVEVKR